MSARVDATSDGVAAGPGDDLSLKVSSPAFSANTPIENAGYPFHDEMIAVMTQYAQLYADVSTTTWVVPRAAFYDHLEALVRAGLGKRLMFGSDQMRWPEKISEGIETIKQAPFVTEDQKRDILYHNAVRFLRLDEQPE